MLIHCRCFRNSLPCRPRVRGGGDGLALLAERGLHDSSCGQHPHPHPHQSKRQRYRAALRQSTEVDDDGLERGLGAGAGAGEGPEEEEGPVQERTLVAMVVSRMEGRRMMEGYLRAFLELHRQGAVDMPSAKFMLSCWRQMSTLAGHDTTLGLGDEVARVLRLTPLDMEAAEGNLLLDAPLATRCAPFARPFERL